ncbi:hypothetical protein HAX54_017900 [Datura stramonium]|uniref:Uncharacterized protein n=1 Tax=Datura stramonium TaxID=4076 RepID=A0ABS8RJ48_DATST|nr:hypothetical protein [Datura stramonium]
MGDLAARRLVDAGGLRVKGNSGGPIFWWYSSGNGERGKKRREVEWLFSSAERESSRLVVAGFVGVSVGGGVRRFAGVNGEKRKWWWPETKERERGERRRLCLGRGRKMGKK